MPGVLQVEQNQIGNETCHGCTAESFVDRSRRRAVCRHRGLYLESVDLQRVIEKQADEAADKLGSGASHHQQPITPQSLDRNIHIRSC